MWVAVLFNLSVLPCASTQCMRLEFNIPMESSASAFDVSSVAGNVSNEIKEFLGNHSNFFTSSLKPGQRSLNSFANAIQHRAKVTELSVTNKAEEPHKLEGRAVLEIEVTEGTH